MSLPGAGEQPKSGSAYAMRPLTAHDAAALAALTRAVWNRAVPLEHLRWKYAWPPDNERGWIVTDASGAPAAASGYWPRTLWIHGRETPGIMIVDMMSHPDHRGRVYRSIAAQVRSLPFRCILYGFTNSESNAYYRRLFARESSFRMSQAIPRWIAPLSPFGHGALCGHLNRLYRFLFHAPALRSRSNGLRVELDATIGPWADELWERVKGEYPWIQYRGADYLSWRYCANPDRPHTIMRAVDAAGKTHGMMVTTLVGPAPRGRGMILDWLTPRHDTRVFDQLLSHALVTLAGQGASCAEAWLLEPGNAFAARLKRRLFVRRLSLRYYLVFAADAILDGRTITPGDVFIAMGDADYPGAASELTND